MVIQWSLEIKVCDLYAFTLLKWNPVSGIWQMDGQTVKKRVVVSKTKQNKKVE